VRCKEWTACLPGGMLFACCAPGLNAWWLAWVGLIPLLRWADNAGSRRSVLLGGFCFGLMFQGVYCGWLFSLHPLTWLGFTGWASGLIVWLVWLLVAVQGGLLTSGLLWLYRWLRPGPLRLILFPCGWVLTFSLQHLTPLALPWALLEYTQAGLPLMRALAAWGHDAAWVSLALLAHNVFWAQRSIRVPLAGLLLPLLVWLMGKLPVLSHPDQEGLPLPVTVFQADLPIERIRTGALTADEITRAYLKPLKHQLTHTARIPGMLAVYPEEGVINGIVLESQPFAQPVLQALQQLASRHTLWITLGASTVEHGRLYNSMVLLAPHPDPVQFYHKRRLVPFGEDTPYGWGEALRRLLEPWQVFYSAPYVAGAPPSLMRLEGRHAGKTGPLRAGGLLCFELIDGNYPGHVGFALQYARAGASVLINESNLGWFHQNPWLEAQFLAIGQMRAAESRLPLIIASNTGVSALISASGVVLSRTAPLHDRQAGSSQTQQLVWPPAGKDKSFHSSKDKRRN